MTAPGPATVFAPASQSSGPPRLLSLDVFRGLTIAAMIVVNNPGAWGEATQYGALRHAPWHGCTPTDLVFPFFLFIVGVAIPYSIGGRAEIGRPVARRILRRAGILFGLGLLLHSIPRFDFGSIRIPGVLQRIALVYLVAALLQWKTGWRAQAGAAAGLLLGYWLLLAVVPVPGGKAGVLEKEGCLPAWLDVAHLEGHLHERAFDPEGILSTLPAIGTALLGVLTGHWLRSEPGGLSKSLGLLVAGGAAALAGLAWGTVFPINKPLWTSSYTLYTGGLAAACLGLLLLAEARSLRVWGKPFVVLGTNAIAAFVLSGLGAKILGLVKVAGSDGGEISAKSWLWREVFKPLGPPKAASLLFALAYTGLFWALAALLYRFRIFVKV